MKTKLIEAGIEPREVKLQIAISKFQNDGGTLERLIEIARTAYQSSSEGSKMSGAGHSRGVRKDHRHSARPAHPISKEPSVADKAALVASMKEMPTTLFDRERVGDGKQRRVIGDVRNGSVDSYIRAAQRRSAWLVGQAGGKAREIYILQHIKDSVANADPNALIRDTISERRLQSIISKAKQLEYRGVEINA